MLIAEETPPDRGRGTVGTPKGLAETKTTFAAMRNASSILQTAAYGVCKNLKPWGLRLVNTSRNRRMLEATFM